MRYRHLFRKCAHCQESGYGFGIVETPELYPRFSAIRLCTECKQFYDTSPEEFKEDFEREYKRRQEVRKALGKYKTVDSQRRKVYRWERYLEAHMNDFRTNLSLAECQEIADIVCKLYSINPVEVVHKRSGRTATCGWNWRRNKTVMSLPDWAKTLPVVLHEISHAVTKGDKHGPRFVRVFVDLMDRFGLIKTKKSCAIAKKEYGIKISKRNTFTNPVNRVTIRKSKWLKV